MQIEAVLLKQLVESPKNPRKTFANMDKLIASVKANGGLLVPLIVRVLEDATFHDQRTFEIIAGHRRFRAAKAAGLLEVPCDVRKLSDEQALEIQLTENNNREPLTELEEAEHFGAMIAHHGYAPESISKKLGVSLGTVYQRLKLLQLSPEAQKKLAEEWLPASVAVPLARLPHALQAKALVYLKSKTAEGEKVHARSAIEWIQTSFCRSLKSTPFDQDDKLLIEGAEGCGTCPKNTKTATPGLFDDFAKGSGAFCTDTLCFDLKTRATWEVYAANARGAGHEVIPVEESQKLFGYGGALQYGNGYVLLDQPNLNDKNKRTWRDFFDKLGKDARPTIHVGVDQSWTPREMVLEKAMRKALAEAPGAPAWIKAEEKQRVAAAEERVERKEAAAEEALRSDVTAEALSKIASKVTRVDEKLLGWVLLGLGEAFVPQPVLDFLGHENRDGFEKALKKGDRAWMFKAIIGFAAYGGNLVDTTDGYSEALKALAKEYGVDVKAIEKAMKTTRENEAQKAEADALFKKGGK